MNSGVYSRSAAGNVVTGMINVLRATFRQPGVPGQPGAPARDQPVIKEKEVGSRSSSASRGRGRGLAKNIGD